MGAADPIEEFHAVLARASDGAPYDPVAVTLATADPSGRPSARIVLLRGVDQRGFVFYTESDEYFAARPRGSQIGALASDQSRVLTDRATLEARYESLQAEFGDSPVPRPRHWGGYRIAPDRIEFWKAGTYRLHQRHVYVRDEAGWRAEILYP